MSISPVPELVAELAAGRMVILVDEEDRENEGDLVLAAEHVTPEAINFMARHARGLICLTLTRERCERLQRHQTRYGVHGVDRSRQWRQHGHLSRRSCTHRGCCRGT
jgi:3,4-dihydroxy-2-butanone 4-phosphate synthase